MLNNVFIIASTYPLSENTCEQARRHVELGQWTGGATLHSS